MAQAKHGDTVTVHYTGKLDDGTVFDSSHGGEPFEVTLGEGMVIPGFEEAVLGMNPGDTRTAKIPFADAYGPHRQELLIDVGRDQLEPGMTPQVGERLRSERPDGSDFVVVITNVTDASITVDANHPLAGKDLTFEITLVEILAA
jgi:peptidylprolyl isomerase